MLIIYNSANNFLYYGKITAGTNYTQAGEFSAVKPFDNIFLKLLLCYLVYSELVTQ